MTSTSHALPNHFALLTLSCVRFIVLDGPIKHPGCVADYDYKLLL